MNASEKPPRSHRLSPPGSTEDIRASSALVLAPHYDDEVLGCGGLVARLTASDAVVRVLFLSDSAGESSQADERRAYSQRRRAEAQAATEVLGVAGIDDLDLPDGGLDQHLDQVAKGIRRALISQRPELLLVPSPLEASADHRAAFGALHRLLVGLRPADLIWPVARDLEILAYEINRPLYPDLLVDIGKQVETLGRAMACYTSQQEQHDYFAASLGLAQFRTLTLPPDVRAAEGYRRLSVSDFQTHGPTRLIAELGGAHQALTVTDGPRISVVLRTKDRPELLAEALASLAASTYRRAAVVLVNDGGAPPVVPEDFPLTVERVDLTTNQGRAAAANAGVAAARGDYVTFLDDDDLVEPDHLAMLAELVQAAGVKVAYSDAAVGVYDLDAESGWRCAERRLPYSRDFDPELLLFDNYIPFNTLLIERALFDQTGEFDLDLPFFEDWDYLIRLAGLTPFHHLARVTCEYRHFRGGGHHILGDSSRKRSDFVAMKARVIAKHADRHTPVATAQVIDRLRSESVAGQEEASGLRRQVRRSEERYHQLNGKLSGIEVHQQVLEESERRVQGELRQREQEVLDLRQELLKREEDVRGQSATLRQTYDEIERLNELIQAMESSKAWRLHQWWQRRKL